VRNGRIDDETENFSRKCNVPQRDFTLQSIG